VGTMLNPDWPPTARAGAVFLAGIILACSTAAAVEGHVVLVTVDGLAAYYLSDPRAPLTTLRKLAAEGAVADGLRVANPSTTWPNHTTLVTGVYPQRHSVLFNGVLVRSGPGGPVHIEVDRNQGDLVALPTIYDLVHRSGRHTAAINWPCTRGSTTLDDNFPDAPDRIAAMTPRLRAELVRARVLDDYQDTGFAAKAAAAQDQAWCAAALHLLQVRPPDLLLLHLLGTDAIQHRYGPQSPAAYTALALADAQVAEVLRVMETGDLRGKTTLIVASDHGFERPAKLISPNVILRKAGLLRPSPRRRAQSVSEGGIAFVYLTNPSTARDDRTNVLARLSQVQGIERILEPAQYSPLHLPDPNSNPQAGDLLLVAKEGYAFSDEFLDDEVETPLPFPVGSHGYLSTDTRMNGVLILWGFRIKPKTKIGFVDNVDVAPTVAALLRQEFPGADGKALREAIAGPPPP